MKALPQWPPGALPLVARVLALPVLVELAARGLPADTPFAAESILWRAALVVLLALLMLPQPPRHWRRGPAAAALLAWAAYCALLVPVGVPGEPASLWLSPALWHTTLGTALLIALFAALTVFLAQRLGDRRIAARIGLGTLLMSMTLPLWASPFVTLFGATRALVNAVVALCPVSYLAALAGVDYLRSDWFYRHTPFGGLRYDYPQAAYLSVFILLLLALLLSAGKRRRDRLPASFQMQVSE